MTSAVDGVTKHVRSFFHGQDVTAVFQADGPIFRRVPEFRALLVAPGDRLPRMWTYVSLGCWDASHNEVGHGTEFVMTVSQPSDRHLLHLAMTAYYHAGSDHQRLDLGHTVPIGEGWTEGSNLDHFLVSLPYPFGPDLERCAWEGGHARLLWLLPITTAERDFKSTHGADALERLFDEAALHFWDADRPSVV